MGLEYMERMEDSRCVNKVTFKGTELRLFLFSKKDGDKRMCKRNGNPKHSSRFICLRCLQENGVGDGIPRPKTREKDHIKDIVCLCTGLQEKTKNLEVRWCDDFDERLKRAEEIRPTYYNEKNELLQ